eukprot:2265290-Pyramimonas_sp.AAC.1
MSPMAADIAELQRGQVNMAQQLAGLSSVLGELQATFGQLAAGAAQGQQPTAVAPAVPAREAEVLAPQGPA